MNEERQVGAPTRDQFGPQLAAAGYSDALQVAIQRAEVESREAVGHRAFLGSRSHTCSVPLTSATVKSPLRE